MNKYKVWSIEDVRKVLDEISEKMGVDCSDIPIKLSGRMKRTMGVCNFERRIVNGKKQVYCLNITLAKALLNGDYSEEDVKTVIIHEYVHLYTNLTENQIYGHNNIFKDNCRKAGIVDHTYLAFEPNKESWKYEIKCNECDLKLYRHRISGGIFIFTKRYRCSKCGGEISVIQKYSK